MVRHAHLDAAAHHSARMDTDGILFCHLEHAKALVGESRRAEDRERSILLKTIVSLSDRFLTIFPVYAWSRSLPFRVRNDSNPHHPPILILSLR